MILALSPHLDDAVFSAGGYLAGRAAGGPVRVLTVFTGSVPHPTGFALSCQLDKGLGPEVDYMKLRRTEDEAACNLLGLEAEHWPYLEAPHRGYSTAAELFTGVRADDPLPVTALGEALGDYLTTHRPTEVLYPIGAGNHVDHLQLIRSVAGLRRRFPTVTFRRWYDMPYARAFADRYPELGVEVPGWRLERPLLLRKARACAAYRSQVNFQFGGVDGIRDRLGAWEYFVEE